MTAPLLIVTVEDEVTGTGSLVYRLIFGVTESNGEISVLRDWELLKLLNELPFSGELGSDMTADDGATKISELKSFFDAGLKAHAPTLRKPISWPEILLLPTGG